MENIKFKKILKKEIALYIVFGVFTTTINLTSFYIMANILKWNENLSNFIAIIIAILFAYVTNKDLVFHSYASTKKERSIQFIKFVLGRGFTIVIETIGGYFLFQFQIPNMFSKGILTVIVIALNFFISKFFAFKKNI